MQTNKPHVALLASPGLGHLIPVLELGKRLASHHDFRITIFILPSEASTAQIQLLESPQNMDVLNIVSLPSVDISTKVDPAAHIVTKIIVMMRESLPGLLSTIAAMKKSRPTALIVDLFGTEALPIADKFKMLKYVFITSNAWFLAITVYAPTVEEVVEEEHVRQRKPLKIPGCKAVGFEDTLEAYLNRKDILYEEYARIGLEIPTADGIFVNTFESLEPTTLQSIRDAKLLGQVVKVPLYPIGPIVRPLGALIHPVLDWLDRQPSQSVVYVSFGSGGTLSAKQMTEIAWGLELSQQRFIWVVRPPTDNDASGTFFTVGNGSDGTPDYLPEGFLTRIQDRGLVLQNWAPQTEILAHPSVGGFVSHCGWNSTMESLVNGVPLVAWPLYAEQNMNAAMLTEELGLAIRPRVLMPSGIVERKELEMTVRTIMVEKDGQEMRDRAKELKCKARKALSKGGSSYNSLSHIAKDIEMSLKLKAQGA